ncbi:hypothetical protein [Streptomyces montanus]|nr:hypothetical protein [Streptomyces montanus]
MKSTGRAGGITLDLVERRLGEHREGPGIVSCRGHAVVVLG